MSTKVEFHVLASSDLSALDRYLCAQLAQWVASGMTACVITDDLASAERFDTALWTFSDEAFVAHEVAQSEDARAGAAPLPPVLIAERRAHPADILINLGTSVPDGIENYGRVIECIDADPSRRDAGRRRFVVYRDRGFPPDTLKIGS
jgi:DNA polymerase-3 subunit chi